MTIDLINDPNIKRAQAFCIAAHEAVGQKRKYTNEPYWRHPFKVAEIVNSTTEPILQDVIAAYLHDVVEDTQIQLDTIRELFGEDVSWNVFWLTEHYTKEAYPDLNRYQRKQIEAQRLAKASYRTQTIKVADLIDNTSTIVQYDKKFAMTYIQEKEYLLNFLTQADQGLRKQAYQIIADAKIELGIS